MKLEDETSNNITKYVQYEIRRIAEDLLLCQSAELDFISRDLNPVPKACFYG